MKGENRDTVIERSTGRKAPVESASIGRIVLYTLTARDAEQINRRRTSPGEIQQAIADEKWPEGAQAHIGNQAHEGQVFPAVVVRKLASNRASLRVMLDGTDDLWATTIDNAEESTEGHWHWPPRR